MLASLSLDLDNQWAYMKTSGDAGWESYPSYLDVCVPRILKFLKERDLPITFFVVGKDADLEKNHNSILQISEAGYEIANHSFMHEPWLHLYSKDELGEEFRKTEDAIEKITGKITKGFRGPGFSLSPAVLEVLVERTYEYDCTTLPTYIAPLARAFFFFKSPNVSKEEREKLKKLFGKFSDGFQSLKPYTWEVDGNELTEIPVTTLPIFKTPIHASYVVYLSTFSKFAARNYWKTALKMCKIMSVQPSFLLHPLDFLNGEDVPDLKFFPSMNLKLDEKLEFVGEMLDIYSKEFEIVDMQTHARSAAQENLETRKYAESFA